jgi:uncharacterized protein (DUF433 family)
MQTAAADLDPIYSIGESAKLTGVGASTIYSWTRPWPSYRGKGALITPDGASGGKRPLLLSFCNVLEVSVLAGLRRKHQIEMTKVRRTLDYLQGVLHFDRPLLHATLHTDGRDVIVETLGTFAVASADGQQVMPWVLAQLQRVEIDDERGVRYFPATRWGRSPAQDPPREIVVNTAINFGRPSIVGTRISTVLVADLLRAGERPSAIATEFGISTRQIQEAARLEGVKPAA